MNDVTKKYLGNIIENMKHDLESIDNHIKNIQQNLYKAESERNKLIEEIEALEKDLNK